MDNTSLCLSVAAANSSKLEVDLCDTVDAQHFAASSEGPLPVLHDSASKNPGHIKHVPSGRCIVASNAAGSRATLADCDSAAASQVWLLGSSGRFCASKFGSLCLRADAGSATGSRETPMFYL